MRRRRRSLLVLALAAPLMARAQAPRVRRVGLLLPAPMGPYLKEFRARLRELGWTEGANIELDVRSADGRVERFPALARELAERRSEVIVAASTSAARAAMGASATIPVVFGLVADPMASGLVASFAQPGGNVTGVSSPAVETVSRQLELLKALVPNLERIAALHPAGAAAQSASAQLQKAAARAGVTALQLAADKVDDLEPAFAAAARERAGGMLVPAAQLYFDEIARIVQLARKHRLATVFGSRDAVAAGGLASYGLDYTDAFARSARYVDRILRGAKPAELAVERSDRVLTVVNRKTAAELGLKLSATLLARADEVIE